MAGGLVVKGLVAAVDAVIVTTWFFSAYLAKLFPSALAGSALTIFLVGYLVMIWLTCPAGRPRMQLDQATYVALLAGVAYLGVTYEPALVARSALLPVPAASIAGTLVYSVLFGVFLQSFLFNLNFRNRFTRRQPGAMALPYALFLILFVPLSTLQEYAAASPGDILTFVIVDLFGGSALFVVLLILYAKSDSNNLPGLVFYVATAVPSVFSLLLAANPILELFWLFAAFAVAIVFVEFLLPATWVERRLFPTPRRTSSRSSSRATIAGMAAVGAVAVTLFLVLPVVLGTPHPLFADATGSMAPQIEPGSLLIVRHVSLDSIRIGDVLVFNAPWSPGVTFAHRVIAVLHTPSGLEFQTRGIANPEPDTLPVPASNVYGIVWLVIPWIGYIVLDIYIVLLATAVAVGGYVVYSAAHPHRSRHRPIRMPS